MNQVFEIIGPGGDATIEAENELVACVAVYLAGKGWWSLVRDDEDHTRVLPVLAFSGPDAWLEGRGIRDLHDWSEDHRAEIARALRSVAVGSARDREMVLRGIDANDLRSRREAVARWNESERGASDDAVGRALRFADVIDHIEAAE